MATIPEKIELIVDKVRAEWDADNLKRPFFELGHPIEIFNKLSAKDQNEDFKYDKYPLIALFLNYDEDSSKIQETANNITIVIMTETNPESDSPNRYIDNFVPTLEPIYRLFLKYLYRSTYFASDNDYQHTKKDRLYYGKEDEFGNSGNIGNDALDAIVITGLDLKVITKTNCK